MAVEISTDRSRLDVQFIYDFLHEQSYWARDRSLDQLKTTIANSLCFGGYDDGKQIAFARVVTDYVVIGYIADVFVDPAHRGRGVSKQLMATILAHPQVSVLRTLFLFTNDAQGLYAQFGFTHFQRPERAMARRLPHLPPA